MSFRTGFLLLLCALPFLLRAQEIKYIDLTYVRQRTELRYPPAPQSDCKEGKGCIGGGYGGSLADDAPDQRDPHALGIYLLDVMPREINPVEPFQVEFKILNSGTASIELPVSPNLSELQPSDESEVFSYFSLALAVRGEGGETQKPDAVCMGSVELYGSADHPESLMVLRPGEWVRVKASVRLHTWPSELVSTKLRGDFWLRKNTFHPHPGGQSVEAQSLSLNATRTPYVPVRLLHLVVSEQPKQ